MSSASANPQAASRGSSTAGLASAWANTSDSALSTLSMVRASSLRRGVRRRTNFQKPREQPGAGVREEAFRMELQTEQRMLFVADGHDLA